MQFTTCGFFIQPSYIFNVKVSNPTCFLATILDFQLLGFFPGAPLTNFNDGRGGGGGSGWVDGGGGPTEVHILFPEKSQLQNLSTQKITTFLSIPQKIP